MYFLCRIESSSQQRKAYIILDEKLRHTLLSLSTAMLADARFRLGLPENHLDSGIRPVVPFSRMVGTAVTAELEMAPDESATDLSLLGQAYEAPGEAPYPIIVIQVPEEAHHQGIFGEGAATNALQHGFVGALVEGAVRDSHELQEMEFPAFSRAIAPGYIVGKVSVRKVGEPVVAGGRTIRTGDAIVADNDGVMVVGPEDLQAMVDRAQAIKEWEIAVHSLLAAGKNASAAIESVGPMP